MGFCNDGLTGLQEVNVCWFINDQEDLLGMKIGILED